LSDLEGRIPIYLSWSEDSQHLACLSQQDERLYLSIVSADGSRERDIAVGTPLYVNWICGRAAAFVGGSDPTPSRLVIRDPVDRHPIIEMPGMPGHFCAPVWAGGRLVYVWADPDSTRSTVVSAELDGNDVREIETLSGLVSLLSSPSGNWVARGVAPDGEESPHDDLALIEPATGKVVPLVGPPCRAFFWLPDDAGLVTVSIDPNEHHLVLRRVAIDGDVDLLAEGMPTREMAFYVRFFEQYAQSHSVVDPVTGDILFAGQLVGQPSGTGPARLWRIPTDGATPQPIREGVFAVFARPLGKIRPTG
jgi:hypothetical protein